MTGYHRFPTDDAWRQVTLDSIAASPTNTLWLHCDVCTRHVDEKIADFRARTGLPGDTPLRIISIRLRCTKCGQRKAHCWPKPYSITGQRQDTP